MSASIKPNVQKTKNFTYNTKSSHELYLASYRVIYILYILDHIIIIAEVVLFSLT